MKNKKLSKFNTFSFKRKITIISFTVILVLLASVGTTIAFLAMRTGAIKNIFDPISITCQVNENNYTVTNTGDYSAYIRASVIVNYVKVESKADGDTSHTVYGVPPKASDYNITYNTAYWDEGADGFYYYKTPVNAGDTTEKIVDFASQADVPDGYEIKVQILADAIQNNPTDTVESVWGVTVDNSGNISK